ncbi:MAG: hypothetical protein SFY66_04850 [Oculatellaceae cyanobacterium bins.114]|nr:hypothetical protein [Oculatellaceae cyanobacterium bins.114]
MIEPTWVQQPEEPDRWYGRFHRYLLMGSGRSLLGCLNQEEAQKGSKKLSQSLSGAWREASNKWQWKERANSWDQHQRDQEDLVWQERRRQMREKQWEMSQALMAKAEKMLQFPLTTKEVSEDGRTVIKPAKWGFRDAAAMTQLAVALGRQSSELWGSDLNAAIAIVHKYGFGLTDKFKLDELGMPAPTSFKRDEMSG